MFDRPWHTCALLALSSLALMPHAASARGVSPYLPLNLEPEMERQIERVLILGDKPVLTRPIAAAIVLDALPKACRKDQALCDRVRAYLHRYMGTWGIGHASLEVAATHGAARNVPNRYGLKSDSSWEATASAYWQPNDYMLATAGGVAYAGDSVPSGSMLSLGFSRAQLDLGFRPHWLSPMTDSSLLIGTEAPTMPSVTLSNYVPLTRLGLTYEAFIARMSRSDDIIFHNAPTSGYPRLAGFHLAMEPASGWALGLNRLMQYGGGGRPGSLSDLFHAIVNPSRFDNTFQGSDAQFGNQVASFTSRFLFPGKVPFAVYFEHAGEDTSHGSNYLLGNAALSAGIHFPKLWQRFDLTYEASEWQNAWYVHSVYQDGLRNKGSVIGHWFGDERVLNDAVGGQSHMVRIGWEPSFGGLLELKARTLANAFYSTFPYSHAYDATVRYSRDWREFTVGGEVFAGRTVFHEHFSQVGAFIRYRPEVSEEAASGDDAASGSADPTAEVFVDVGANANKVKVAVAYPNPGEWTGINTAPHFALGARRAVSEHNDLGARLELDKIDGHSVIGVRAIDFRHRFAGPLAINAFLGALRYDLATPAYGIYYGVGGQWRNVLPHWDLGVDVRYALDVARDNLLPTDQHVSDDSFYDIASVSLYVSRRF